MQPNYPEVLTIKFPRGFSAALSKLASREYSTTAETVRRALHKLLNDAGIEIDPAEARPHVSSKRAPASRGVAA